MKKFLLIALTVVACTTKSNNETTQDQTNDSTGLTASGEKDFTVIENFIETKNITDTALVHIVNVPCAVFSIPDSLQIEEMKKEYGEEDFYTIADDVNWYNYTASETLDSLGVRKIDVFKKYVRFKGEKGDITLNLKQQKGPGWNLFFFHPKKSPKIVSTTEVTPDKIKSYFFN